jgi:hypothetical protein
MLVSSIRIFAISSQLPAQLNPRPKKPFKEHAREFDFLGLLLSVGGVVCILLGFNYSETSWSDAKTIGLLVAGVVLLALCAVNESMITSRRPIFPPRMFKTLTTTGLLLSTFIQSVSFTGASFYLPNYFQVCVIYAVGQHSFIENDRFWDRLPPYLVFTSSLFLW